MGTRDCLFKLLRYGLGKTEQCIISAGVDWKELLLLSQRQGVEAIVLDGVDRCYNNGIALNMDFQIKMDWIGDVQQLETIYEQHKCIISKLAKFYLKYGIRMMLMKGVGLSYNYPVPKHRPCGDIDIYLYGDLEKGDKLVHEQFGTEIDHDHHKHTVFQFDGATVENHYDFVNYHKHRSSKKLDEWLKENCHVESIGNTEIGENVYLPSTNFNAVFLIRHAACHFAAEQITLRHLLDWAFFVEKHHEEVDWEWHWNVCKEQNMHQFLLAINSICVQYLGFDAALFRSVQFDPIIKEKVLNEILSPEFPEAMPKNFMKRMVFKYRRWKGNAWKHELCNNESRWSAFWSGVWGHLLKPKTI